MRCGQHLTSVKTQGGTAGAGRPDTEGPNGGTGACQKKIKGLTTAAGKTAGSRPVSGAQRIMSFHGYAGLADGST